MLGPLHHQVVCRNSKAPSIERPEGRSWREYFDVALRTLQQSHCFSSSILAFTVAKRGC
jgi:hypothetical protein